MSKQNFGLWLLEKRLSYGMTQPEFAKAIGITTNSIVNYEKSRRIPAGRVLVKIANFLEIPLIEILERFKQADL